MRVDQRIHRDIVVIEPQGRLTIETEADFVQAVRGLLDAGRVRFVLNLAGVPYIDSSGLGAIAQAYTSAWRRGGDLKLLNVSGRNLQLLTITNWSRCSSCSTRKTPRCEASIALTSFDSRRPPEAALND